jgi:hypothetical protein
MAHAFYVQMGGIVVYEVLQSFTALQGQEATDGNNALEVSQGKIITSLGKILLSLDLRQLLHYSFP